MQVSTVILVLFLLFSISLPLYIKWSVAYDKQRQREKDKQLYPWLFMQG